MTDFKKIWKKMSYQLLLIVDNFILLNSEKLLQKYFLLRL